MWTKEEADKDAAGIGKAGVFGPELIKEDQRNEILSNSALEVLCKRKQMEGTCKLLEKEANMKRL